MWTFPPQFFIYYPIWLGSRPHEIKSAVLSLIGTWYHSAIVVSSWILPTLYKTNAFHCVAGDEIQASMTDKSIQNLHLVIFNFNFEIICSAKRADRTVPHNSRHSNYIYFNIGALNFAQNNRDIFFSSVICRYKA